MPLFGLRGLVLNDLMYVSGGAKSDTVFSDKIYRLEYDPRNTANISWSETGTLNTAVSNHAVSVIDLSELRLYC